MLCSVLCGTCPLGLCMPLFYTFPDHSSRKGREEVESTLHFPSPYCFILKQVSVCKWAAFSQLSIFSPPPPPALL